METIEIKHLEELSKLEFSEQEREKFKDEFKQIVDFVDEVAAIELPVDLVLDIPQNLSELREDEPQESMAREAVLSNAPIEKDGCYVTPLVVE